MHDRHEFSSSVGDGNFFRVVRLALPIVYLSISYRLRWGISNHPRICVLSRQLSPGHMMPKLRNHVQFSFAWRSISSTNPFQPWGRVLSAASCVRVLGCCSLAGLPHNSRYTTTLAPPFHRVFHTCLRSSLSTVIPVAVRLSPVGSGRVHCIPNDILPYRG